MTSKDVPVAYVPCATAGDGYQAAGGEEDPIVARKLTADDILNFIGFGRFQVITFFLAGLAYISYGMDVSVWIFIGIELQDHWHLSNFEYAFGLASTALPNVIGVFLFSFLSDRFGRVWPFAIPLAICGIGGLVSGFAPNYLTFVAFRWIVSFGVGGVPVQCFPTLLEVLPVRNRGKFITLMILLPAVGLCMSAGLAWWLMPNYPDRGWRYYMFATAVPSLLAVVFRSVFYYDSPRFLLVKGKLVKSWKVFSAIARMNRLQLSDFMSEDEFYETFSVEPAEVKKRFSVTMFFAIFKMRYLRTTLSLTVLILTASFGYLGSTLFLPQFLVKELDQDPYFSIFVAFVAQIPGLLFMSIIIEWPRVGRLNAMRLYSLLTVIFFLLFAFIQTPVTIPVFLVFLYFCMIPILSLIYTYVNECYPTDIRAQGNAYIYSLQLGTGLVYPFVSGFIAGFDLKWLYPVCWAGLFTVQFVAALILKYEPYGRKLMDTVE